MPGSKAKYLKILERLRDSIEDLTREIEGISDFLKTRKGAATRDFDRNIILIELADAESRVRDLRRKFANRSAKPSASRALPGKRR
ncbi:MAG: hypothetical protein ACRD16_09995 [Thermoanaerobaculia bacterium]